MNPGSTNSWSRKAPAIGWALLIFALSSIPSSALPKIALLTYDKLIHVIIFFIFGILVYFAFGLKGNSVSFRWSQSFMVLLIVIAYGVLDEFHQSFVPGRTPDFYDAMADTAGGCLSAVSVFLYTRMKN